MVHRPVPVMVVDDHPAVRRGIAAVLEAAPDITVCAEAGSVEEAEELAEATQPSVVVIDIRLPDGSGIEASRNIRTRSPRTRVVVLTGVSEDEAWFAAVMAGACAYLVKQLIGTDLVCAVRAAARGERLFSVPPGTLLAGSLPPGAGVRDSPRQEQMLALVVEGCSDGEIANALNLDLAATRQEVAQLIVRLEGARAHGAPALSSPTGY